jgi:hypothetical protein
VAGKTMVFQGYTDHPNELVLLQVRRRPSLAPTDHHNWTTFGQATTTDRPTFVNGNTDPLYYWSTNAAPVPASRPARRPRAGHVSATHWFLHGSWAMRCLVAVTFLIACGRLPAFPVKPLPELVSAEVPSAPLAIAALALESGESLIWDVHWKGITIGRAELVVSEREVRSRFKTGALASAMVSIEYELETALDRAAARATTATERLAIHGETTLLAVTFDGASYAIDGRSFALPGGNPGQTLHSALGAVRAWAAADARPGFLLIVHAGQLVRLDVARPVAEQLQGTKTLRVDGRVRPQGDNRKPLSVTVWLTDDQKRTPIRIEITAAGERVTAELIDATAV